MGWAWKQNYIDNSYYCKFLKSDTNVMHRGPGSLSIRTTLRVLFSDKITDHRCGLCCINNRDNSNLGEDAQSRIQMQQCSHTHSLPYGGQSVLTFMDYWIYFWYPTNDFACSFPYSLWIILFYFNNMRTFKLQKSNGWRQWLF